MYDPHPGSLNHDQWTVIVVVSGYQDARLNLKFAERDASQLYELLWTPAGGIFADLQIIVFINHYVIIYNGAD